MLGLFSVRPAPAPGWRCVALCTLSASAVAAAVMMLPVQEKVENGSSSSSQQHGIMRCEVVWFKIRKDGGRQQLHNLHAV